MRLPLKISILVLILSGIVFASYADRGINKRAKKKISVHIPAEIQSGKSALNATNNATYKGSVLNNCEDECAPQSASGHYLMTYQKGNSLFILPVRQKVFLSDGEHSSTIPRLVVKPS